jgi:hypothetical protein
VVWENGGEVWVNRGGTAWTVEGRTLPQYGFYARIPSAREATEAAIELRDGGMVEWARSSDASYYSARPYVSSRLPLTVQVGAVESLEGRRFRVTYRWSAAGPIPAGYRIFVHFTDAAGNILFQGDHAGPGPSESWSGAFDTSVVVTIPASLAAGAKVEMRLGLYNPAGGARPQLDGLDDGARRIRLGSIEWTGAGVVWSAFAQPSDPLLARYNSDGRTAGWDGVATAGAFRLSREGDAWVATPLPGGPAFEIRLRLPAAPETVEAVGENGAVLSRGPARVEGGEVLLQRDPSVFAYRLR